MPSKKKKYNARFPAGRIKKIMQTDEEVGKVAQAVPVIISRTLELFVESLLTKTLRVTNARNAKTLSPSHMKQCIMAESRFDFLRELVKNIPDINVNEDLNEDSSTSAPPSPQPPQAGSSSSYPPPPAVALTFYNNGSVLPHDVPLPAAATLSVHQPSVIQHTSTHRNNITKNSTSSTNNNNLIHQHSSPSNHYGPGRPPKLARYDSAPASLSAMTTPNYKIEVLQPKINTPIINCSSSGTQHPPPMFNIDLSLSNLFKPYATPPSYSSQQIHNTPPTLHSPHTPGVVKIELATNLDSYPSLPSTSTELPTPPIIRNDVCNTPIIKIDYSKIVTVASPLTSPEINVKSPQRLPSSSSAARIVMSPTANASPSTSSSTFSYQKLPQQTPPSSSHSVNIDMSTLNSSLTKFAKTIYPPPSQTSSALDMDEDYDNI